MINGERSCQVRQWEKPLDERIRFKVPDEFLLSRTNWNRKFDRIWDKEFDMEFFLSLRIFVLMLSLKWLENVFCYNIIQSGILIYLFCVVVIFFTMNKGTGIGNLWLFIMKYESLWGDCRERLQNMFLGLLIHKNPSYSWWTPQCS